MMSMVRKLRKPLGLPVDVLAHKAVSPLAISCCGNGTGCPRAPVLPSRKSLVRWV
jgi:hypothetical protein